MTSVDDIGRNVDSQDHCLHEKWLDHLHKRKEQEREQEREHFWLKNPRQLVTRSHLHLGSFTVGNGVDIYSSTILPALETAKDEIIFVTCFWARSKCLTELGETLLKLNQRASVRPKGTSKLRIRLCFSSRSLAQKLFHTSSPTGHVYKLSEWASNLGLPDPESLTELDLQVKSLFFLPFSVMHPKFVIIDRNHALLPSCNLSFESWFEGCISIAGPIVDQLLLFWKDTWGKDDLPPLTTDSSHAEETTSTLASVHTITLLPSPHHRSPRFRPFSSPPGPPQTPLNLYLDDHVARAQHSIKILTPNLTCHHVIRSLLAALDRGTDVTIITNRRMMVLEQLLTAGTLTELCVRRLKKRYKHLRTVQENAKTANCDLERGLPPTQPGLLRVGYFRPDAKYAKSHLKCTIIDEKMVVLGSGNMDRASWYTSQELGVAINGNEVVKDVWGKVEQELGRGEEGEYGWVEWV